MYLSARFLGKTVAERIATTTATPVLVIGRDVFYRRDLAIMGCFNFNAAQRLSAAMRALGAKDTRDVFNNKAPTELVLPQIGSVSLSVLGAAFQAKELGGDAPLDAWAIRHRPTDARREMVTFDTMKHAEAKREVGEQKARKARKARTHARRDQAQRLRVDRFTTRQSKGHHVQ